MLRLMIVLLVTVIIELSVMVIYGIKLNVDSIFALLIANTLTNTTLNIFIQYMGYTISYHPMIVIAEIIIIIIESTIYKNFIKLSTKESLKLSAILNVTSYIIGLFINI